MKKVWIIFLFVGVVGISATEPKSLWQKLKEGARKTANKLTFGEVAAFRKTPIQQEEKVGFWGQTREKAKQLKDRLKLDVDRTGRDVKRFFTEEIRKRPTFRKKPYEKSVEILENDDDDDNDEETVHLVQPKEDVTQQSSDPSISDYSQYSEKEPKIEKLFTVTPANKAFVWQ